MPCTCSVVMEDPAQSMRHAEQGRSIYGSVLGDGTRSQTHHPMILQSPHPTIADRYTPGVSSPTYPTLMTVYTTCHRNPPACTVLPAGDPALGSLGWTMTARDSRMCPVSQDARLRAACT